MAIKHWILASRPKTLPAGICPVIIGAICAYNTGQFHGIYALVAGICSILIQIATNFANDYYDFKKGSDTKMRKGPERMVQSGKIAPESMKKATYITFLLALSLGVFLMLRGGLPIVIIGILSIIFGLLYTAGPYSLAHLGLGDIFVFIFFGPVATMGTVYVETLSWSSDAFWLGSGAGLISVAILAINNLRDYREDRQTGKKTLVVRFGKFWGHAEYVLSLTSAIAILVIFTPLTIPSEITIFLIMIYAAYLSNILNTKTGKQLNPLLPKTALLLILYTLTLAIFYR